tara:strand:- start:188 stop:607 length:420 start_codon:yes stop_codon:yes gene_type:complete
VEGEYKLLGPDDTRVLGQSFSAVLKCPEVVYLEGDLGAGKTTLVQGIVSGLGSDAAVVSPTYTLVEEYLTAAGVVHHLDLYRIQSPDEVESLALRDRCDNESILLIEWPERGAGGLPIPSWKISMRYGDQGRTVCITRP